MLKIRTDGGEEKNRTTQERGAVDASYPFAGIIRIRFEGFTSHAGVSGVSHPQDGTSVASRCVTGLCPRSDSTCDKAAVASTARLRPPRQPFERFGRRRSYLLPRQFQRFGPQALPVSGLQPRDRRERSRGCRQSPHRDVRRRERTGRACGPKRGCSSLTGRGHRPLERKNCRGHGPLERENCGGHRPLPPAQSLSIRSASRSTSTGSAVTGTNMVSSTPISR